LKREEPIETRELIAWFVAAAAGGAVLALALVTRRALREARRALGETGARDPRTGAWSRRAVLGFLEAEVARCRRGETTLGVLMVAVDDLSGVAAALGSDGEAVALREAARRIERNVRIYDSVGYHDGGRFLAVLPGCDAQELTDIAERVRMLMERTPFAAGSRHVRATVTIGGVTTQSLDEKSADRLVRSAEKALGEALAGGRNRVRVTEPLDVTEESSLGLALETVSRKPRDGEPV